MSEETLRTDVIRGFLKNQKDGAWKWTEPEPGTISGRKITWRISHPGKLVIMGKEKVKGRNYGPAEILQSNTHTFHHKEGTHFKNGILPYQDKEALSN